MRSKSINSNILSFACAFFVLFLGTVKAFALPQPAHIVIVIEENHDYAQIIGTSQAVTAPYFNTLDNAGANMSNSHGYSHASEDNYFALFAGNPYDGTGITSGNLGTDSDACPLPVSIAGDANLGSELIAGGFTFASYNDALPSAGSTVCTAAATSRSNNTSSGYARKHNPWSAYQVGIGSGNIPVTCDQPFTTFQGISDYSTLPTVSFVVPDLWNDMHDGPISISDAWLQTNLANYAAYCQNPDNNSLLIVTWDENVSSNDHDNNQIPTIIYGSMVTPGSYSESINHYNVLKTLLTMYNLPMIGGAISSSVAVISDIFSSGLTSTPTDTPTPSATSTPSNTPTNSPTATPTDSPTDTITGTLTPFTDTSTPTDSPTVTPTATVCLPRPDHIVILIDSDEPYSNVLGTSQSVTAPYLNSLAATGAVMTNYNGINTASALPNWMALFAGVTLVSSDSCPAGPFSNDNLASGLIGGGFSFTGYSELLPLAGSTVCTAGTSPTQYAAKHAPWVFFNNLTQTNVGQPFSAFQAITDYSTLPTISFVVPDTTDDMRNGLGSGPSSITVGDTWAKNNLDAYYQWAMGHNSLFVVMCDYGMSVIGPVPMIMNGPMVVPGTYSTSANHYNFLATLEDMYGVPLTGGAVTATAMTQMFNCTGTFPTATSTPSFTSTASSTPTDTPTNTPLITNTPSDTPTNSPSNSPTNSPTDSPSVTPTSTVCLPRPDHIVILIDSDEPYSNVLGTSQSVTAPYLNSLAAAGASLTNYNGINTVSALPNWMALFAGATLVSSDSCPAGPFSNDNLASGLIGGGFSFTGYSELLPLAGSTVCTAGTSPTQYAAKHAPWVFFNNLPQNTVGQPFSAFQAITDYSTLPTISFVVPNTTDDMRNGLGSGPSSITVGDTWVKNNLDAYYQWAMGHNSMFIVMFDYGMSVIGPVPMIMNGPMVVPGTYSTSANHYNLLATLEDMYGVPLTGGAVTATAMTQMFNCTSTFPTATATPSFTSTASSTPTGTPTNTPLITNTPSDTPTNSPSVSPTNSPTDSPTVTPTNTLAPLVPGSVAFTALLYNGTTQFSFVSTQDLVPGQMIYFTNYSYDKVSEALVDESTTTSSSSTWPGQSDPTVWENMATTIVEGTVEFQANTTNGLAAYNQVIVGSASGTTQVNSLQGGIIANLAGAGGSNNLTFNHNGAGHKILAYSTSGANSTGVTTWLGAVIFGPNSWQASGSITPGNFWDSSLPSSLDSTTSTDLSSAWNSNGLGSFNNGNDQNQNALLNSCQSSLSGIVNPANWAVDGNESKKNLRLDQPIAVTPCAAGSAGYTGAVPVAPTSSPTFTPSILPTNSPTNSPTLTPTDTATTTPSDTPTVTATDTPSNSPSETPVNTSTDTPTDTASTTPTDSPTNSPTLTPTDTATTTPSDTPTNTTTDTPSNSPSETPVNTSTNTATNTPTDSPTSTPTSTPTNSPTNSPTPTATTTPSNTATSSPTATTTNSTTLTPTNTPTNTASSTPSNSPTNSSTTTPTNTASSTSSNTPTPIFTSTYTPTISPTFTSTATRSPTATPQNLSGMGHPVMGPVPVPSGGNLCLYPDKPILSAVLDAYDLMGGWVGHAASSGNEPPCWNTQGVRPGVYAIRMKLNYSDSTAGTTWQKVLVSK